jgi:hypothetical protein
MKKFKQSIATACRRCVHGLVRMAVLANGWKRYRLGFCPKCNSSAPELYDCEICRQFELQAFPYRKAEWWKRFVDANTQISGGTPSAESDCSPFLKGE